LSSSNLPSLAESCFSPTSKFGAESSSSWLQKHLALVCVSTLRVSKQALIIWTSLAPLHISPLLILCRLGHSAGNQSIEGVHKYSPPLPPPTGNYGGGGGDVADSGGGQGRCRGGHVE